MQRTRLLWVAVAALLIATLGVGGYAWNMQSQLTARIDSETSRLDAERTLLASALDQTGAALGGRATELESGVAELGTTIASVETDLQAALTQQADDLAVQLASLDTTLGQQITTQGDTLRDDVQSVQGRLDEVRTELLNTDTALQADLTTQTSALQTVSTDLDALEADAASLQVRVTRAVLDVTPLYDSVKDSVVEILDNETVLGSGFLYGEERKYIVTVWHVVEGISAFNLQVKTRSGSIISATVAGKNQSEDTAILELSSALSTITPLTLADSSQLSIGQPVLVVGAPLALKGSAAAGIISGLQRSKAEVFAGTVCASCSDLVQFDATVAGGNSGGLSLTPQGKSSGSSRWGPFVVTLTSRFLQTPSRAS